MKRSSSRMGSVRVRSRLLLIETFSEMKRSSSCRIRVVRVRVRVGFYWSLFSAGVFLGFVSKATVLGESSRCPGRVELVTALRTLYRFQHRASAIKEGKNPPKHYRSIGIKGVCPQKNKLKKKRKKRQYFLLSHQKKRTSPSFQIKAFSKMKAIFQSHELYPSKSRFLMTQYESTGTLALKVCVPKKQKQRKYKKEKASFSFSLIQRKERVPFFQIETFSKMKRSPSRRSSIRGESLSTGQYFLMVFFLALFQRPIVLGESSS
ncbi:hypothetical protein CEXT_752981 [Caerostris extrusa]|uniref:Uncharacterized protein n=1 Tax=Caerostris extrusa TaxID=172846 RepID=A0AAV4VDU3_CAEEX|nr:hypothetical protein CEXT_752981 [Caerostris extrusa]